MADVESASAGAEEEMSLEARKEEEQAVIQRQIEQTEAQMERLEAMEGDMEAAGADGQQGFNLQELEVSDTGCRDVLWREIIIGDNSSQRYKFLSVILL